MASKTKAKVARRKRIHMGIRKKVRGTAERPRMSIFRSNKEIYVQLIDDASGHTLLGASSREAGINAEGKGKLDISKAVGQELAKRAMEKGIDSAVFDRSGYLYHGRVKALADGAREGGLKI